MPDRSTSQLFEDLRKAGLTDEAAAAVIADADGALGSRADYLFATISHLDQLGSADRRPIGLGERVTART